MKSYDELKAEMETIQQQMPEAKKNERTSALKEVKRLCKEFGFKDGMLKGSIAEGRKPNNIDVYPIFYNITRELLT